LAFQSVLDGEDWSGLTEEERVWEEENRGEVNMPPFPPQTRICRRLGDGLRGLQSLEVCQTKESNELSAREPDGWKWIKAGDPLDRSYLANFQRGAKPAAAFSNNFTSFEGSGAQSAPSFAHQRSDPPRIFRRASALVRRKLGAIAQASSASAGLTHDQRQNTAVATYTYKHTKRCIQQWPTMS
jgi:hypothetical protein